MFSNYDLSKLDVNLTNPDDMGQSEYTFLIELLRSAAESIEWNEPDIEPAEVRKHLVACLEESISHAMILAGKLSGPGLDTRRYYGENGMLGEITQIIDGLNEDRELFDRDPMIFITRGPSGFEALIAETKELEE